MRTLPRLLAVLLAYAVGLHPTVASAQSVQIQAGAAQAGVPYVPAGAFSAQGPASLGAGSLAPSLNLGALSTLPSAPLSAPLSAPAAASVSKVSPVVAAPAAAAVSKAAPLAASPAVAHSVSPKSAPAAAVVSKAAPSLVSLPLSESPITVAANAASPAYRLLAAPAAAPVAGRAAVSKKLSGISAAVAEAGRDISAVSGVNAYEAAGRQFRALTGEKARSAAVEPMGEVEARRTLPESAAAAEPVQAADAPALARPEAKLQPADAGAAAEPSKTEVPQAKSEAPQAKPSITEVFKDPARNRAFWRYTFGYTLFMVGYEFYATALPFLISSFTRNTLRENNDLRAANADAVKTLIRENRSFARIAHYAAQGIAYFSVPLFSKGGGENAKNTLVKSTLLRAGIIVLIPALFFASGVFSVQAALYTLLGLIAFQSFVQGIAVTMDSAVTAQITGDKSVSDSERIKANSIFTLLGALTAIIGPAIAGQISLIKDHFGKTGIGSAILYGLYGVFIGLAGLAYATIRMMAFKSKKGSEASSGTAASPEEKAGTSGLRGVLKGLVQAVRDGTKLVLKNRFLRTVLIMSLITSLFSDPLIFNVLPEFVESVLTSNPSTLGWIMNIPVVGWVLKGMTSTPTGYFSLLTVFASLGSITASLLIAPLRRLLDKVGLKTEEAQVAPFYFLAALEAPLFWLMISTHSALAVVSLYGLQTLVTSFAGMLVSGLHQKTMGGMTSEQMNSALAAESILGIIATIISTYLYGFLLGNIPIATSMLIAAVAISVLAAFRLVAPWLYFSKEERARARAGASQPGPAPAEKK